MRSKRINGRLFAIWLAVCILIAMMPMWEGTVYATDESRTLYFNVNDGHMYWSYNSVTKAFSEEVSSSEVQGWSCTSDDNGKFQLNLEGINFITNAPTALYLASGCKVNVTTGHENYIASTFEGGGDTYGIFADTSEPLAFVGNGTLNATSGTITTTVNDATGNIKYQNFGIYSKGSVSIADTIINTISGAAGVTISEEVALQTLTTGRKIQVRLAGIYSLANIYLSEEANLTATGGACTLTCGALRTSPDPSNSYKELVILSAYGFYSKNGTIMSGSATLNGSAGETRIISSSDISSNLQMSSMAIYGAPDLSSPCAFVVNVPTGGTIGPLPDTPSIRTVFNGEQIASSATIGLPIAVTPTTSNSDIASGGAITQDPPATPPISRRHRYYPTIPQDKDAETATGGAIDANTTGTAIDTTSTSSALTSSAIAKARVGKLRVKKLSKTKYRLTWNKPAGLDRSASIAGYVVSRATKKNGKYIKLGETKKRYFTTKKLKKGVNFVKVRGFVLMDGKRVYTKGAIVRVKH